MSKPGQMPKGIKDYGIFAADFAYTLADGKDPSDPHYHQDNYAPTHSHTREHAQAHSHTRTHSHAHTHAHTHTDTHTHTRTHTPKSHLHLS